MTQYIQTEGGTHPGKLWFGKPISCDICTIESPPCFIDGQVLPSLATEFFSGRAIMCQECFKSHGKGIGNGMGQKYCKKE